ncbi:hypothetical protein [Methyloterricola oryzae]|uniref:hypothetical protein n=1 Tax=Methyloterricola oryzae TaxID=1495050 RepID=UPI0009E23618
MYGPHHPGHGFFPILFALQRAEPRRHPGVPDSHPAGGTGLAPVLSMVRRMHEWKEPQETRIYFGVTHQHEAFYIN